jgi:hypothetical protein
MGSLSHTLTQIVRVTQPEPAPMDFLTTSSFIPQQTKHTYGCTLQFALLMGVRAPETCTAKTVK